MIEQEGREANRIQVRCIGCQSIGYVPSEDWTNRPCPKCGCSLTDWVKVPSVHATKSLPKCESWDKRSYDDFHGDLAELRGTGTEYTGRSKPKRLEDRDDFVGLF